MVMMLLQQVSRLCTFVYVYVYTNSTRCWSCITILLQIIRLRLPIYRHRWIDQIDRYMTNSARCWSWITILLQVIRLRLPSYQHRQIGQIDLMMIAFISSGLVPLIEGLCAQISYFRFQLRYMTITTIHKYCPRNQCSGTFAALASPKRYSNRSV